MFTRDELNGKLKELKVITLNQKFNDDELNCLKYTIQNDEDLEKFMKFYNKSKIHGLSYVLSEYKNYIRSSEENYKLKIKKITLEIQLEFSNKNYNNIRNILENVFLMTISDYLMQRLVGKLEEGIVTFQSILKYHIKYPNRNLSCALVK